ncbi:MAG TPA: alpha/beta hydrolase [Ktedonobacterales bacterium]|nr:alpha/beta hydrolase [Ktedonobacterales bacterium]
MAIRSSTRAPTGAARPGKTLVRRLVAGLLLLAGLLTFAYAATSIYLATNLVYAQPVPIKATPAEYGLRYTSVSFPSRGDHIQLRGWFIPGVLPDGKLTTQRVIITVHGTRQNRTDPGANVLDFVHRIALSGFAVLAFDIRGQGESEPAPLSMGYFEYRDVLGAVDFIHNGRLPYPELGRPRIIGGWGLSLGGTMMLYAGAQEKALAAIVADSPAADILPVILREMRKAGVPPVLKPGGLLAAQALYGMDWYDIRTLKAVTQIPPRPLFLIQGAKDDFVPLSNHDELMAALRTTPNASVQEWLVPGAKHAQGFNKAGNVYVNRVVTFFNVWLGPDTSAG